MSQQNSNSRSLLLKVFIFIIIWILCLVGTYGVIKYKKFKPSQVEIKEKVVRKNVSGISIYDTYDENSLKIGGTLLYSSTYENYITISNLKDKAVENKINTTIKDSCGNECTTTIYANFGNILSLTLEFPDSIQYLNFDLTTGNELVLEDLFTNDSDIYSILSSAFYEEITRQYGFKINDEYELEYNDESFATVEDDVLKIIRKIKKDDDFKDFYVTSHSINIVYDKYTAVVRVSLYGQYFAYPNRFKTKDTIYETSDYGYHNLAYGFGKPTNFYKYGMVSNDLYVYINSYDYMLDGITSNEFENVMAIVKRDMDNISTFSNENNFNIISGLIYYEKENDIISLNYDLGICTMDKEFKNDNKIKDSIYKQSNVTINQGGFFNFSGIDAVSCKPLNTTSYYIKNGSVLKVNSVAELFTSDFDYDTHIKNILGFDSDDYVTYKIDRFGINVIYGDETYTISFDEIGYDNLNI